MAYGLNAYSCHPLRLHHYMAFNQALILTLTSLHQTASTKLYRTYFSATRTSAEAVLILISASGDFTLASRF